LNIVLLYGIDATLLPKSSIGRKKFIAITGLILLGFVFSHLAGNLLLFAGPETFNAYAANIASLRPGLYVVEAILALIFLSHIFVTLTLVKENRRARGRGYAVSTDIGQRSLSARIMPYTGGIVFIYVVVHIWDFTFDGFNATGQINGDDFGLFGVVYNSFKNPVHALSYILAMITLGFHLGHAIQSVFRTFGWYSSYLMPKIIALSILIGVAIALLYSSIPVAIFLNWIQPVASVVS